MTIAIVGNGTTLQLDNAAGSLTSVGEVTNVKPYSGTAGTVEATHLSSTSGYREYIATLSDGGEAAVTVNYLPGDATDVLIRTAVTDRLVRTFKIVFPNTKYIQSECFVTSYDPAGVVADGKMEMTFNVKFTGVPTYG